MKDKEIIKLSASMIGGILGCPACFWRDYHHPQEFHLPGILGRMDRIEKEYYDKFRNEVPPILKGKVRERLVDMETAEKFREGIVYFDEKLNAQFKGKMDDCFIDEKEVMIVMDNKTASPSDGEFLKMYQLQLDSYAFLLKNKGYKVADYGYLIYYIPESGDPQKGVIFRAEAVKLDIDTERVPGLFKKAVELLRMPKQPTSHKDCEECKWIMEIGEL